MENRRWGLLCLVGLRLFVGQEQGRAFAEAADPQQLACSGWECYSPEAAAPDLASRRGEHDFCDLRVLDGAAPSDLHGRAAPGEPVLLRGAASDDGPRSALGREALVEASKRQGLRTRIGNSWDIVMNRGEGLRDIPLHEYIETVMLQDVRDGDDRLERPYAFDRRSEVLSLPSVVLSVPEAISSWNASAFTAAAAKPIFLLGGPESGVGFHRHASAVQITFHGVKRWFFYPPAGNPPGGVHGGWPVLDWLRAVYPRLDGDRAPRECIQSPGDVMYIPEGWYHATINLADSVAVSLQREDLSTKFLKLEMGAKTAKNAELQSSMLRRLLDIQPTNLEARLQLFRALKKSRWEGPQEILEVVKEVIQKDQFLVEAQYDLAEFLADRQAAGDPSALTSLKKALTRFRPFLESNTRNVQANHLLGQLHLLEGRNSTAMRHFRRNVKLKDLGVVDQRLQDVEGQLRRALREAGLESDGSASAQKRKTKANKRRKSATSTDAQQGHGGASRASSDL